MDIYKVQFIIGIIEDVTPKLKRNRTEDLFSGTNVEVSDSKDGDGKSQIITQLNKVYVDKFTKKQYEGSKYNSKVEIITEDKKIKKVKSQFNLTLKNENYENENNVNFGFDSFEVQINSNITLIKLEKKNKEVVQLVKKLSEKYEYLNSEEFMKNEEVINSLLKKEEEEDEEEEEENKEFSEILSKRLRQLGSIQYEGSLVSEKELFSFKVFNKKVIFAYNLSLTDDKIKNVVYAKCEDKKIEIGNAGYNLPKLETNVTVAEMTLKKIPITGLPVPINIEFKIGAEFDWGILFKVNETYNQEGIVMFYGLVYGKVQANVGVKKCKISVGIKGDLLKANVTSSILHDNTKKNFNFSTGVTFSTAKIDLYIKGKICWVKFSKSWEIFEGIKIKTFKWSDSFNY